VRSRARIVALDNLLRRIVATLALVPRGPRSKQFLPLTIALALLVVGGFALAAVVSSRDDRRDDSGPVVTVPAPVGPFRGGTLPEGVAGKRAPSFQLADARGGTLSTAELRGRPYVLTLLYTDCPDVCPLIGEEVRRALELLGPEATRVAAVAVSVDPEGDTPRAARAWLRRHRLPRNFHYLVGSRRELEPVWKGYYAAPQAKGVKESRHTASVWVVDARGRWRTKFSGGVPFKPSDLAHDLRLLLGEAG
jgi:protein SCO1/2